MALVIPYNGKVALLDLLISGNLNVTIHLYKNDYTPTKSSAEGDFTEADFTGYAAVAHAYDAWGMAALNGDNIAEVIGTDCDFESSDASAQTVYGYYVLENDTNQTLLWAERFASSRTINENDIQTIRPRLRLKNLD